jgi:hypothetical protein
MVLASGMTPSPSAAGLSRREWAAVMAAKARGCFVMTCAEDTGDGVCTVERCTPLGIYLLHLSIENCQEADLDMPSAEELLTKAEEAMDQGENEEASALFMQAHRGQYCSGLLSDTEVGIENRILTHSHTHSLTHTYIHTITHTHTLTHSHTHTHTLTLTLTHSHSHSHTRSSRR